MRPGTKETRCLGAGEVAGQPAWHENSGNGASPEWACDKLANADFAGVTAEEVLMMPALDAVIAIRAGLPASEFVKTAVSLGLTLDQLARKVGASARDVRRQAAESGVLSRDNSDRLVRVVRAWRIARKVFTTDHAAAAWMSSSAAALNGEVPVDLLDTDLGAQEVESLLQGIAHGNVL